VDAHAINRYIGKRIRQIEVAASAVAELNGKASDFSRRKI
jgi:hypothetical protein